MGRHLGLVLLFLLVAAAFAHAAEVRGVHPSDASLYSGSTFSCKDKSKTGLPLSKVNDDYCDCKDGSDEPGTSACENGRFFCPNRGHIGVSLFSSRVNDGICDCCDGSDEYDGKVKCENTCYALGEGTRSAKRTEIEAFKKGLEIRRQYEAQARTEREQKQSRLNELQAELVQKEKLKSDLQAQIAVLEDKAKAAEELLAQYKPKETPAAAEGQESQPEPADDEEDDAEEYDDSEEDVEDVEDVGQATETQEEPKVLLERTDDVKEVLEQAEKDVQDLKELRHQRNNAQNDVDKTATEINNIEEYLKLDLGEDAFHGIRGQTFELHTNQYTYKLTPFKEVRQQHTRLGDWGSWLNPEHTKMEYSGGERCWNGPDRKTIVVLTCSDTNRVISVQEPNKCEYEMLFNTPAACSPERLALLEQELAMLESPEEVVLPLNTNDIF